MRALQKGTICMVVENCIIKDAADPLRNIKGHLVYGRGVLSGGRQAYVLNLDEQGFTAIYDKAALEPIDPADAESSLTSAYRKSQTLGRVNPFLHVPMAELKEEFEKYKTHFTKYLSR